MSSSVFRRVPSTRLRRPIRRSAVSGFESIVNGFWEAVTATTYPQSMSATETAIASFPSKIYTWAKSLPGIAGSTTVISGLSTFYRILTSTGNGVASFIKGISKFLTSTMVGILSLIPQFIPGGETFYQTLTTTSAGIATLIKDITHVMTLIVQSIGSVSMGLLKTFYRTLTGMEISNVVLEHITTFVKYLSATAVSILERGCTFFVNMAASTDIPVANIIMTTGGKLLKKIKNTLFEEI
jgi:hypothetical protein